MRFPWIIFGTFLALACLADSAQHRSSEWTLRAIELGIQSAHVVIEYSLTDDCQLAPIRVVENSSPRLFDAATLAEIVDDLIGPFEFANRQLLRAELEPPTKSYELSMSGRMFRWDTNLGHNYIVCRFYTTGDLADAVYTDGNLPAAQTVENRPVARRLSSLGTRMQKVNFEVNDGDIQ